jgi:hypothetical protein
MNDILDDLQALGDQLESATTAELTAAPTTALRRAPSRRRKVTVGVAVGLSAAVAVSGTVAAAISIFSPDEVARGMPNGATMFQHRSPRCTALEPGVVFDCTVPGGPDQSVEKLDTYLGTIEVLSSDHLIVSGGCRGQNASGTKWICYVGERAVKEGLISQDFLGTKQPVAGGVG